MYTGLPPGNLCDIGRHRSGRTDGKTNGAFTGPSRAHIELLGTALKSKTTSALGDGLLRSSVGPAARGRAAAETFIKRLATLETCFHRVPVLNSGLAHAPAE